MMKQNNHETEQNSDEMEQGSNRTVIKQNSDQKEQWSNKTIIYLCIFVSALFRIEIQSCIKLNRVRTKNCFRCSVFLPIYFIAVLLSYSVYSAYQIYLIPRVCIITCTGFKIVLNNPLLSIKLLWWNNAMNILSII